MRLYTVYYISATAVHVSGVPTPTRQRMVANTVQPVPDAVITVYVRS